MKILRYPSKTAQNKIDAISNRGLAFRKTDVRDVTRMIEDVRKNGDKAIIDYTRRFDAPRMKIDHLMVSRKEIDDALKQVDRSFVRALNRAAANIEAFHKKQVEQSWISTDRDGVFLGRMVNPVEAAGIYVPGARGGKTPLVSSVLMGGIPAKIAGVGHIAMVTPPGKDNTINPHLIVAAKKAGIDRIYKIGSAWAIAALAYGTETIKKVDVIAGPGNIYVTLAKKLVAGTVGIDMIAGPSEILVIADKSANPGFIAADLLSQAEHDPLSSAVLITDSEAMAEAVSIEISGQLNRLDRQEIASKSLADYGLLLVVPDLRKAFDIANRVAPEHLELMVENPFEYVGLIQNAGAVFMGDYTPEPAGDYLAGPNHVLPTAGTARFASALSVEHFMKKTSLIHYSKEAFRQDAKHIIRLAEVEGLGAHAESVRLRLKH